MRNLTILGVLLAALAFVAINAAFVIDQAEQGIIVQFGEPIGDVIDDPGLHWRVPFIQEVRRFDKRLLAWDGLRVAYRLPAPSSSSHLVTGRRRFGRARASPYPAASDAQCLPRAAPLPE